MVPSGSTKRITAGKPYINKSLRPIAGKSVGQPSFGKLGPENVQKIFAKYYELSSKNMQDAHLFGNINAKPPARKRTRDGSRGAKKCTYTYHVSVDGCLMEICMQAFLSIYSIGKKRLTCLKNAKSNDVPPVDKRGLHGNQPRTPQWLTERIEEHIRSFLTITSHYSRHENPNKRFLHQNLNVKRMWLMYLGQHDPEEKRKYSSGQKKEMNPQVGYSLYKNIFMKKFNLGFGHQKSDTCLTCDHLTNQINDPNTSIENKKKYTDEKELHLRKAESAYKCLQASQLLAEACSCDVFTFDFQQNLPSPILTTSDIFYARQLWTYNFGIHDCSNNDGIMHRWGEHVAGRGSSEVCSMLYKTVLSRKKSDHLKLFSDGCCGQNKNKIVLFFLQSLIEKKVYKSIDHIFLVRSHTFLPNDRDFSSIEIRKKTASPMIPSEWNDIVTESHPVKPFIVNQVEQTDFLDCKKVADTVIKPNFKTSTGEVLKFRDVMWFSYGESPVNDFNTETTEQHATEVWCCYSCPPFELWKKISIFKRNGNAICEIPQKYSGQLGVKKAKLNDLKNLCKKVSLPNYVVNFYNGLTEVGNDYDGENPEDYGDN